MDELELVIAAAVALVAAVTTFVRVVRKRIHKHSKVLGQNKHDQQRFGI